MLGLPQKYPNRVIAEAVFTAFSRHLWFFSEQLAGLALFDSRVNSDVKRAMAKNLQLLGKPSAVKRAVVKNLQLLEKPSAVKRAMVKNLELLEKPWVVKKVNAGDGNDIFVSKQTNHLFKL